MLAAYCQHQSTVFIMMSALHYVSTHLTSLALSLFPFLTFPLFKFSAPQTCLCGSMCMPQLKGGSWAVLWPETLTSVLLLLVETAAPPSVIKLHQQCPHS